MEASGSNPKRKGKLRDTTDLQVFAADATGTGQTSGRSNFIDLTLDSPPATPRRARASSVIDLTNDSPSGRDDMNELSRQLDETEEILNSLSALQLSLDPENELASTSTTTVEAPASFTLKLDLDEDLACPICCDLFVSPVSLICGHSFCDLCAHDWLQRESVCPACRHEINGRPTRIYALDSLVQKYFEHQLSALRLEDKASEALAMQLEREERVMLWEDQHESSDPIPSTSSRHARR